MRAGMVVGVVVVTAKLTGFFLLSILDWTDAHHVFATVLHHRKRGAAGRSDDLGTAINIPAYLQWPTVRVVAALIMTTPALFIADLVGGTFLVQCYVACACAGPLGGADLRVQIATLTISAVFLVVTAPQIFAGAFDQAAGQRA